MFDHGLSDDKRIAYFARYRGAANDRGRVRARNYRCRGGVSYHYGRFNYAVRSSVVFNYGAAANVRANSRQPGASDPGVSFLHARPISGATNGRRASYVRG